MKNLLLLCCGLLLGSGLYAQQIEGYNFSVAFGYTMPVGSFASSNWQKNTSGLANNGLSLDLAYNYTPDQLFGVTGGLYFSNLTTNNNSTSDRLENIMGKLYRPLTNDDRKKINYESNDWRWGSILVGPRLVLPCGKGVFDAKVLSGVQYTYLPYQQMVLKDDTNNRTYNIETADKNKFSIPFRFSTSWSYPIQKKMSFKIQADYYRANTSYTLNKQIINNGQLAAPTATELYKIHIQTISFGAGVVYDLN